MSRKLFTLALTVFTLSGVLMAQAPGGNFGPGATPDPLNPQSSIWGSTGLWKVISAETPPHKAFGTAGWMDRITRNPGNLRITGAGASVFFGASDRVELGIRINVSERILMHRADEMSFGQATLFSQNYSGCIGCPV